MSLLYKHCLNTNYFLNLKLAKIKFFNFKPKLDMPFFRKLKTALWFGMKTQISPLKDCMPTVCW